MTITSRAPVTRLVYSLISSSGGIVHADRQTGELVHEPGAAVRGTPVFGLVTDDRSTLFLCPSEPIGIRPEGGLAQGVLPFRLDNLDKQDRRRAERWALRDPETNLHLSAADIGRRRLPLPCNRDATGEWETFHLLARVDAEIPAPLVSIDTLFRSGLDERKVAVWLRDEVIGTVARSWRAVVRALPAALAEPLAEQILSDTVLRRRLGTLVGDDRWLGETLHGLLAWADNRVSSPGKRLDDQSDFLAAVPRPEEAPVAPRLISRLRAGIEPRGALAIVTVSHNDGIHLLEWIAHHRALGVEHFFIYHQDAGDGAGALLQALASLGVVTLIEEHHAPGVNGRRKSLMHALSCCPDTLDYRWTLAMDVDDYLVLQRARFPSLADLLAARESEGASAVAFGRYAFRPGNVVGREPRAIIDRFRQRDPAPPTTIGSAFVTRHHVTCLPDGPVRRVGAPLAFVDAAGRPYQPSAGNADPSGERAGLQDAWIASYPVKSFEEFLFRRFEGEPTIPPDAGREDVLRHIRSVAEETLVTDERVCAHLFATLAGLRGLRDIPEIAEAERAITRHFRRRVEQIKEAVVSMMGPGDMPDTSGAAWLSRGTDISVPRAEL